MSSIVPRTNSTSSTQSILQLTWVVSTAPVGYRRASSDRSIVLLSSLTLIATTRRTEEHCQQKDSQHHQQLHQQPCQSVSQSGGADGKASERHAACTAVNYEIQANLHADTQSWHQRAIQQRTKVCRYNWHSAGSPFWPFPMLR